MTTETTPVSRAERKKQELRREIIEAAFDCFAERGYHATGIADIAARLGMGHGTFYRYFQNKRDIVDHVITDLVETVVAALAAENAPEAVNSLAEYRVQSARIGDALGVIFGNDPRMARFLLLEAAGIDAEMRERVLDFYETAAQLTAAYLYHGVNLGYLHADLDVDATARAINGMVIAGVLTSLRDPGPGVQARMSAAIRRVMYDGIAARA
ncbi:TetR/AcrR family transcriptional regulator [Kibdelosporangium philippinense]|uniref:TetR/AcrR family transcriptional regulator n=1 Tax=Kibdelosporangium philippinense TaxID=211113 RepID=A0ABS8ZR66_9PSEU|nr:TetR/AcrR family transcriptional regulator [Kibdelosporangium philippinense]MCE7010245.1 TetR/AcrR family transcriptional regulator [Kibdelosporangium philippinense]